jgi:hypothetical protein
MLTHSWQMIPTLMSSWPRKTNMIPILMLRIHYHGNGLTAGVAGRQGMLTSPRHLIPPPVYPGVRVSQFISLTRNSYLCFKTDHLLVA